MSGKIIIGESRQRQSSRPVAIKSALALELHSHLRRAAIIRCETLGQRHAVIDVAICEKDRLTTPRASALPSLPNPETLSSGEGLSFYRCCHELGNWFAHTMPTQRFQTVREGSFGQTLIRSFEEMMIKITIITPLMKAFQAIVSNVGSSMFGGGGGSGLPGFSLSARSRCFGQEDGFVHASRSSGLVRRRACRRPARVSPRRCYPLRRRQHLGASHLFLQKLAARDVGRTSGPRRILAQARTDGTALPDRVIVYPARQGSFFAGPCRQWCPAIQADWRRQDARPPAPGRICVAYPNACK